jgi:UTP--glucose-1-phosphate uridylyltransferase
VSVDEIDSESRGVLERFGFDDSRFAALRRRIAVGDLNAASNVIDGDVEPIQQVDLTLLPEEGSAGADDGYVIGLDALRAGQVAHLVLAGGMATRFGGVVKAVVEALDGRSFLEITLDETARVGQAVGRPVPTVLMTSFATDEVIRAFIAERGLDEPLVFNQFVAPRLEPSGELFYGADGKVSLYGPGHGDLVEAIRTSGTVAELRRRGVRYVVIANVDNLGARIDPGVIGAHILAGRPLTLEVAPARGDVGGLPARVDGTLMMIEGPRLPSDFDVGATGLLNTNTGIVDLEVLAGEHDLTWLYVERQVDGRSAVQLERLYHELSARLPTTFLVVPRGGPYGRFLPVKSPPDLVSVQEDLRRLLARPTVV